jgi:hypothetical protein
VEKASPALLRHAENFYQALEDASVVEEVEGNDLRIFRGSTIKIFRALGISQSYYSRVIKGLGENGCITQLQRGARTQPSVLVLHNSPNAQEFAKPLGGKRVDAVLLAQRLDNIQANIGGLDIAKALVELQNQINALKARVSSIEGGGKIGPTKS